MYAESVLKFGRKFDGRIDALFSKEPWTIFLMMKKSEKGTDLFFYSKTAW